MTISPQSRTNVRGKLLFFVTEDWYFCSHRLPLAVSAQAAGYEVVVLTRVRAHGGLIRDAGLRLIPFEIARTGLNPFREAWTLFRLMRLYRGERPALLHHVALKPVLYGSIAARWAGRPAIVNALAGMGWLFSSRGATRGLRRVVRSVLGRLLQRGLTLVQNPDDARMLVEAGVPASLTRRIPGAGVDLNLFRPQPEPAGIPIALFPARLLWDKGAGEFVAAARILRKRNVALRFVLAGEPDSANPSSVSHEQLRAWESEGVIEHSGWIQDMPGLLAASHLVCLPSYYGEGIPKSLIEAAAAGRPIVTTDMPGCREVVSDGRNGYLVPPRDAEALANALERLSTNAELRRRMGSEGRRRAEESFGLEAVIQQTLSLYEEALK
jgi:glycosyltransferase involved in cell wall biosynthesis